jgi:hypothetical protein
MLFTLYKCMISGMISAVELFLCIDASAYASQCNYYR